ncbi:MAG: sugar ABC transporter permease [Thermofilaceae archaeon]
MSFLRRAAPYLLVLPSLVYALVFTGYPLAYVLGMAFSGRNPAILEVIFSPRLGEAALFTAVIVASVIPAQLALAIFASLFFLQNFRGRDLVLYIFVIPLAVSEVAAALLWYTMLSSSGFLNKALMRIGLISRPIYFFGYQFRDRTLLAIILTEIWRASAIVFVIIYAGLQMINREYLEAADVFGMSFWQKLRYVILPLLKPSIQTALVIRTLFALQIVGPIFVLGGEYVRVLATEVVYWYSMRLNPAVASAWAVLVGAVTLALGGLYIKLLSPKGVMQ